MIRLEIQGLLLAPFKIVLLFDEEKVTAVLFVQRFQADALLRVAALRTHDLCLWFLLIQIQVEQNRGFAPVEQQHRRQGQFGDFLDGPFQQAGAQTGPFCRNDKLLRVELAIFHGQTRHQ